MRQIEFTPSGDRVGAIGFGAMGLSWVYDRHGLTERRKHEVLGLAVDLGMNVVDTAVLYGGGANEELVGAALAPRRDEVFLCSKTGLRAASLEPPRTERCGHPDEVRRSIEDSLRRLRTDAVDLYYLHRLDPQVPVEESAGAMAEFIAEGKIRAYSHSNFSPEQIAAAAEVESPNGFVSAQDEYSLVAREVEREVLPAVLEVGIGFLPYFPLANGLLTGKYSSGEAPEGSRLTHSRQHMLEEADLDQLKAFGDFARERGLTELQVVFSWLASRPSVASVIAGATAPEQVEQNEAVDVGQAKVEGDRARLHLAHHGDGARAA